MADEMADDMLRTKLCTKLCTKLRTKRHRAASEDAAVYASILKRVHVAELQPACSELLEEQLTRVHEAAQSAAAAMQRLHEVRAAVEKLKSAQPQTRDGDTTAVGSSCSYELTALLGSTASLQKLLALRLSKLAVPEKGTVLVESANTTEVKQEAAVFVKAERGVDGSGGLSLQSTQFGGDLSSAIDLLSSGSEKESGSGDGKVGEASSSVKNEKRDLDSSLQTREVQQEEDKVLLLLNHVTKLGELARSSTRATLVVTAAVRALQMLESIDASVFTEHERAASIQRGLKKSLDATVERILNEQSPRFIEKNLHRVMTEMYLVAQRCPHVEAALTRRCERIQGVTLVRNAPIAIVPITATRKEWTDLAKECHSYTKDKLKASADRATWEIVRKLVEGMLKKIKRDPVAASVFLNAKHLKRLGSAVGIIVQWATANPAPRERRDTRSVFLRELKFAQARCEAVRPYLVKSDTAMMKVMAAETRTGECDLDGLRTTIQGIVKELKSASRFPRSRFHSILRLVKFAVLRNQTPGWDPKSVPELKECVAILREHAHDATKDNFHAVVVEDLRLCEYALTEQ